MSAGDERPDNPAPQPMGKAVAQGITWTTLFYGSRTLAQLFFTAVLARLLSPHEYGVAAAAAVFIQIGSQFADLGIGSTIIQLPELGPLKQRIAYSIVLLSSLVCFAVMRLVAPWVQSWFGMPELEGALHVLSFVFFAQAAGGLSQYILLRQLRSREVYLIDLFSTLASNLLVTIPMAWFGYGYFALVTGTVTQALLNSVLWRWRARTPLVPVFSWSGSREIFRTSTGFSLASLIWLLGGEADRVIVGRFLGATSLGIYTRAFTLMALPAAMYGAVAERVVFPAMARVQHQPARLRSAYVQGLAVTAAVGLPLSVFMVVAAPELIRVIFGAKWEEAVVPFGILSIATYFRLSWRVNLSVLRSLGRTRTIVAINLLQAFMVVGGCMLAYSSGLRVVAASVSTAYVVGLSVIALMASRATGVTFGQFVSSHAGGFWLGVVVGGATLATAAAARSLHLSDFLSLAVLLLAAGTATVLAIVLIPSVVIAPSARPFVSEILRSARRLWQRRR